MEHFRSIQRRDGVDVGYHESNLEPLNGVGRFGVDEIEGRIANQARWRNGTFRYKMWIVEWKDREE